MTTQERDLSRLQGSLKEVKEELMSERRLVEAGEAQIKMLKVELRRTEEEIREMRHSQETEVRGSNSDMGKLREQNEKISAENFEYAVENVSNGHWTLFERQLLWVLSRAHNSRVSLEQALFYWVFCKILAYLDYGVAVKLSSQVSVKPDSQIWPGYTVHMSMSHFEIIKI